ncbi:MAG: preprotein translocase subunit SecE [Crocinitomicaceae bacterium]|nr:preprotein translocase subunit SecE [Crocinitomicaceae bacterium]MBK8926291.1 preprotein translocase subunit SecE [Crocinitomicaceae bacterium]
MANIIQYIEESFGELVHKVTWPTWSQLQSSSIVVLVASIIFALIIFAMDFIFGINSIDSFWRGFLGLYYSIVQG